MANATEIIKDAMQDLGVLGAGRNPTSADLTDCMRKANAMLDSWSLSSILVPFRTQISHVLDGSQSYTIGPGAEINEQRPTYIESAFTRHDGTDYPVHVSRDRAQYDRLDRKDTIGTPKMVYYEPLLPYGRLFVHYVGDSSYTIMLNSRGQLTQFADTLTEIDIAPGYYEAIYSNLAISIAPMYEVSASVELSKKAHDSMSRIKRLNRQMPVMQFDPAIPTGNNTYNIESD